MGFIEPVELAPSESRTVATTGLSLPPGTAAPDGDGVADADGAVDGLADGDGLACGAVVTAVGSRPAASSEVVIASPSAVPPWARRLAMVAWRTVRSVVG